MSFIGNTPTQQAFTPAVDVFSGNGSTTAFTLSRPVASVAQVEAVIENVQQSPVDAYTVNGNTITFTSAPPSGSSNIYVRYTSPITQVISPTDGSVGTNQLMNGAVTSAKMAAGAARENLGAGAILQVVTVTSAEWVTRNTGSWGTIYSNLNASIAPIRSSSKLLLVGEVTYNQNTTISYIDHFRFYDATNSAAVGVGSSLGSRNMSTTALRGASFDLNDVSFAVLRASVDAGSTAARTYTIQHRTEGAASRLFNHSNLDSSSAGWTAVSNLTIYEVAA